MTTRDGLLYEIAALERLHARITRLESAAPEWRFALACMSSRLQQCYELLAREPAPETVIEDMDAPSITADVPSGRIH